MDGYTVDIDAIMGMANTCYDIAEMYSDLTGRVGRVDSVGAHLTDETGDPTEADQEIMALLNEFEGYLKTTTSRYYLAGEQLEASARTYVDQENTQRENFEGWDNEVNPPDLPFDPDRGAQDTRRPDEATDDQAEGFETEENPEGDDPKDPKEVLGRLKVFNTSEGGS
jgi:hypothetical protein